MKYYLVEPCTFEIGDLNNQDKRASPSHTVEIKDPFFVCEKLVTQGIWFEITGTNPSKHQHDVESFFRPVESVSYQDVLDFLEKLNERYSNTVYLGMKGNWRLPSEAEWECFARCGTTSTWSFGNDEFELSEFAWYGANSGASIKKTGLKKPNPWNIFDVHGLVAEWCRDYWSPSYAEPRTQLPHISQSTSRVIRGGSWFTDGTSTTSYHRSYADEDKRSDGIGLRLIWEPLEV